MQWSQLTVAPRAIGRRQDRKGVGQNKEAAAVLSKSTLSQTKASTRTKVRKKKARSARRLVAPFLCVRQFYPLENKFGLWLLCCAKKGRSFESLKSWPARESGRARKKGRGKLPEQIKTCQVYRRQRREPFGEVKIGPRTPATDLAVTPTVLESPLHGFKSRC